MGCFEGMARGIRVSQADVEGDAIVVLRGLHDLPGCTLNCWRQQMQLSQHLDVYPVLGHDLLFLPQIRGVQRRKASSW